MWDFFSRITQSRTQQQRQAQGFRFTVIAPQARGEAETMALRENAEDLGATAALVEVIEASTPPRARLVERQTVSLHVRTHVSDVSADSEEYIRNPYEDTGSRRRSPRHQVANSPSSPLAVNSAVQASNLPSSPLAAVTFAAQDSDSADEDYVEVDIPEEIPEGAEIVEPQSLASNLLEDPAGTILQVAAAAVLASGPPGRQYVTSGPPPPDQRGGRARSSTEVRLLPTPSVPLPPVLTRRPRAHSSPVESGTSRIRPRLRPAKTV